MILTGVIILIGAIIGCLDQLMSGTGGEEIFLLFAAVGVIVIIMGLIRNKTADITKKRSFYECSYKDSVEFRKRTERILAQDKYYPTRRNGESVWEARILGSPAHKYIKIEYIDNTAHISGWLGGLGNEESNLNGFMGCLPKKQIKKTIKKIMDVKS